MLLVLIFGTPLVLASLILAWVIYDFLKTHRAADQFLFDLLNEKPEPKMPPKIYHLPGVSNYWH